jgi:ubiquinone/menaquinone biosynthesis C-methylase UbiE
LEFKVAPAVKSTTKGPSHERAVDAREPDGHNIAAGTEMHPDRDEFAREEARIRGVYVERMQTITAERYSTRNPGNLLIYNQLECHLRSALKRLCCTPLSSKRILDVGCGSGLWLRKLWDWGGKPENLFGVDLVPERVARAVGILPRGATVEIGRATKLRYADESFDLVLVFTVFSSILHGPTRARVASEIVRVLRSEGTIVWYDFFVNNPSNRQVRGVGKAEIKKLFPNFRSHFEKITVAAPLARQVGTFMPTLCPVLIALKVFSTHYFATLQKVMAASNEVVSDST